MHIRSFMLLLIMLPALLVPGGSTLCFCMCPEMRAKAAERSCCAKETAAVEPQDHQHPVLDARCSGCHPLVVPHQQVQQTSTGRTEWLAASLHFTTIAQAVVVPPPQFVRTLRWSGARSPSPPGRLRTLPLLI
jgi:hypothetical protein